jgi:hypothetical protein
MKKMRVVQVSRPKRKLEVSQRDIPEPSPGTVRIKIEACHSDPFRVEGPFPEIEYRSLERAAEAYSRMMSDSVRFPAALAMARS